MQAKHLWALERRQTCQIVEDFTLGTWLGHGIDAITGELATVFKRIDTQVLVEHGLDAPKVKEISDTPSVDDDTQDVAHSGPRDGIVILYVRLQVLHSGTQVRVVPVIGHVPAQRAELPPFLDNAVEEDQREDQPLPWTLLGTALPDGVGDHSGHRVPQVGLQPLGGLLDDLHPGLQDGHREAIGWHGCEPEPELGVKLLQGQLLHDLLQARHPGGTQVAVLQVHPPAVLDSVVDHRLSLGALVLPKAQHCLPIVESLLLSKGQEDDRRV
mmetsp:Transcript_46774/g.83819  ORF Transcript_46774/g.83819 Transcript_46774/m.83819 type:complete len:270 (+) Transcript_46774:2787-3596(+)